jgi:hypothetical protein
VRIVIADEEEPREMGDWSTATGDVRNNAAIATELLGFIEKHGAPVGRHVGRHHGVPHQTGND